MKSYLRYGLEKFFFRLEIVFSRGNLSKMYQTFYVCAFFPPACQEKRHASSVMLSFCGCSHCVCACVVCVSTLSCVSAYCALLKHSRPRLPLKQLVAQPRWLGTHEIPTPRTMAALNLAQSDARGHPRQGMRTRIAPMGVCVCVRV